MNSILFLILNGWTKKNLTTSIFTLRVPSHPTLSIAGYKSAKWIKLIYNYSVDTISYLRVTRKYDKRTQEKTNIADGAFIHDGFFILRFGGSKTWKGRVKRASMLSSYSLTCWRESFCVVDSRISRNYYWKRDHMEPHLIG